eukprot:jgi/Psemu1/291195/fgenesh1_pg.646_\
MKFPASSLAILASKAGSNPDQNNNYNGRSLIDNWNRAPKERERHEESGTTSEPERILTNKRGNREVVSAIVEKLEKLREVVECDPSAETDLDEDRRLRGREERSSSSSSQLGTDGYSDEFGILGGSYASSTCGVGRTCRKVSSEETSSLGGLCENIEGWNNNHGEQQHPRQRDLQEPGGAGGTIPPTNNATSETDPYASAIVYVMQYACNYGDVVGYDCVCDFDTVAYTGSATCNTPVLCSTSDSLCGVSVTHCYQSSYYVNLQGQPGAWNAELCLEFQQPYQQTVCYETSTVEYGLPLSECRLSLDGGVCSKCEVYQFRGDNCYVFDCGNTEQGGSGRGTRIGNTCDFPAHGMALFLETYGCPACDLCAPGSSDVVMDPGTTMVMTQPESSVLLFNTTYECSYVQEVSLEGFFTPESCDYFSAAAQTSCGCAAVEVESPTEAPATPTTEAPVLPPTEATEATEAPPDSPPPTEPPATQTKIPTEEPTTSPPATATTVAAAPDNVCKICPNGVSVPDGVLSVPGSNSTTSMVEMTCSEIDEAGMAGSIVGETLCEIVRGQAAGICCGEVPKPKPDYCTLCGKGKVHTEDSKYVSVPTQGLFTCEQLLDMGKDGTLDKNGICLLVQTSAQKPCGCVPDGPTEAPAEEDTSDGTSPASSFHHSGLGWVAASAATTTMVFLALSLF